MHFSICLVRKICLLPSSFLLCDLFLSFSLLLKRSSLNIFLGIVRKIQFIPVFHPQIRVVELTHVAICCCPNNSKLVSMVDCDVAVDLTLQVSDCYIGCELRS